MADTYTKRPYLREQVYETVRELLLDTMGQLEEPMRLSEEAIASRLGVSRTPVREALVRLGDEGIVQFRPRRGAVLMPVTEHEYREWLGIRTELEGYAARLAALNTTQKDVDRLRELMAPFNRGDADAGPQQYAVANVAFHELLIELSGNALLAKIWKLFGHRQMLGSRTIERLHRARTSLSEHNALIDAIEARDAQLAERLARQHVASLDQDKHAPTSSQ